MRSLLKEELEKMVTLKLYEYTNSQNGSPVQQRIFEILDSASNTTESVSTALAQCMVYFIRSLNRKKVFRLNLTQEEKASTVWALQHAFPINRERREFSMLLHLAKMYRNGQVNDSTGTSIKDLLENELADIVQSEIVFWADMHRFAQRLSAGARAADKQSVTHTALLETALDAVKVYEYKLEQIQKIVPLLEPRCRKISYRHIVEDSAQTLCKKIERSHTSLSKMIDHSLREVMNSLQDPEWDPYNCKHVKFLKAILERWDGPGQTCYNRGAAYYSEILNAFADENIDLLDEKLADYNSYVRSLQYVNMPLSKCVSKKTTRMDGDPHGRGLFLQAEEQSPALPMDILVREAKTVEEAPRLSKTQIAFNFIASALLGLSSVFFMFVSSALAMDISDDTAVNLYGFSKWSWQDILAFLGWRALCLSAYGMCLYVAHKQIERWFVLLRKQNWQLAKTLMLASVIVASTVAGYLVAFYTPESITSPPAMATMYTIGAVFKISNLVDMVVRRSSHSTHAVFASTWPASVTAILIFLVMFFVPYIQSIPSTSVV
ncbi:uncharacterized protein NESG_01549 [Nematocida ausubeli]|uniref:Uncharacterized protein n=1 Tax=Nematocida ausubeli (strain ATCC PRA-371 / ERTm2) TaxID=1913371 RepID=A0A086J2Q8_NEMA1|nr:uncharacterized protein NESG_01549 [Nematocida ausubeli]KFG26426.1 hypothetical protein NESG_01549 [Nematocida ausubeli]